MNGGILLKNAGGLTNSYSGSWGHRGAGEPGRGLAPDLHIVKALLSFVKVIIPGAEDGLFLWCNSFYSP